jgi:hypothetical protein
VTAKESPFEPCPGESCPGYGDWTGIGAVPAGHLIYDGVLSHVRRDQYTPATLAANAAARDRIRSGG